MHSLNYKAVLFDFDGVIAHTAPAFRQALWIFLREKEMHAIEEDFSENGGFTKSIKQIVEFLKEKYGYMIDTDELRGRIGPLQIELLDKHLEFDPTLMLFLEHCKKQQIRLAIGSNAYTERIKWVLKKMKIWENFAAVLGADLIKNHKPDPEVWLTCADMLGIPIEECLIIEDGLPGLTGAKRCGAKSVYYHRWCKPEKACMEIAERSVGSFSDLLNK